LLTAVFADDVYRTADADHELRALPVRVAAALGAVKVDKRSIRNGTAAASATTTSPSARV
jgi:hypothetical protein